MVKFLALLFMFAVSTQAFADAPETFTVQGTYTFEDGIERTFSGPMKLTENMQNHFVYEGKIEIANFKREGKTAKKKIELHIFEENGHYYAFFCFNTFSTQFQNMYDLDGLTPVDKKVYNGTVRQVNMFGGEIEKAAGTISFILD